MGRTGPGISNTHHSSLSALIPGPWWWLSSLVRIVITTVSLFFFFFLLSREKISWKVQSTQMRKFHYAITQKVPFSEKEDIKTISSIIDCTRMPKDKLLPPCRSMGGQTKINDKIVQTRQLSKLGVELGWITQLSLLPLPLSCCWLSAHGRFSCQALNQIEPIKRYGPITHILSCLVGRWRQFVCLVKSDRKSPWVPWARSRPCNFYHVSVKLIGREEWPFAFLLRCPVTDWEI